MPQLSPEALAEYVQQCKESPRKNVRLRFIRQNNQIFVDSSDDSCSHIGIWRELHLQEMPVDAGFVIIDSLAKPRIVLSGDSKTLDIERELTVREQTTEFVRQLVRALADDTNWEVINLPF